MRHTLRVALYLFLFTLIAPAVGHAQSPLDVGVHFSPQLRYISSTSQGEVPTSGSYTRGRAGLSMGAGGGIYLEYEITPYFSVRSGVDLSYKRNYYRTERVYVERDSVVSGRNQIVFTSIEVPVALIYRFDYLRNGNTILVGLATTLNRSTGVPRAWSTFGNPGQIKDRINFPTRTVSLIAGYEHNLSPSLVIGLEPYLAYVPTRFSLENTTTTKVQMEGGLSLRLRLDN